MGAPEESGRSASNFHERFRNVSGGIQSVVIAAAVIIGGVWTLYTFSVLGMKAKAEAELFQQAVIDIRVDARQETVAGSADRYVAAVATIENKGNRNTYFNFGPQPAFRVWPIEFDQYGRGVRNPNSAIGVHTDLGPGGGLVLRRGSTSSYLLFVRVPRAGIYLVEFVAAPSEEELHIFQDSAHKEINEAERKMIAWRGVSYVVVK